MGAHVKATGVLFLAVSDKRFFDFFKPISIVGELLKGHQVGRRTPRCETAFDHEAYDVHAVRAGSARTRALEEIDFSIIHIYPRGRLRVLRDLLHRPAQG
jgi:hypothetical protein